jgi:hypothetical protein
VPNFFRNLSAFYAARQFLPSGTNDRAAVFAWHRMTRQFLPGLWADREKNARQKLPGISLQYTSGLTQQPPLSAAR